MICNLGVVGSNPTRGSKKRSCLIFGAAFFVNLVSPGSRREGNRDFLYPGKPIFRGIPQRHKKSQLIHCELVGIYLLSVLNISKDIYPALLRVRKVPYFFQTFSISSNVLPFVSGTKRHTNNAAITQMLPYKLYANIGLKSYRAGKEDEIM